MFNVIGTGSKKIRTDCLLGEDVNYTQALVWCSYYEDRYPKGHIYGNVTFMVIPVPTYEEE